MLDQLDEEFGIGDLVKEEVEIQRGTAYTEKDLRGLRVEHDIVWETLLVYFCFIALIIIAVSLLTSFNIFQDTFEEGQTMILTLKDKDVLDDENDVLVNVNMKDDERYKKSIINKTKKPGYDAYDEDNFDEYGLPKNTVLDKYDEEIEGEKKQSFALGVDDANELRLRRTEIVKHRLANKKLESLKLAEPKLASEYYNDEELAKFRKTKKKVRKIRQKKMLKADDLVSESTDYLRDLGSRRTRRGGTDVKAKEEPADDAADMDDDEGEFYIIKISSKAFTSRKRGCIFVIRSEISYNINSFIYLLKISAR